MLDITFFDQEARTFGHNLRAKEWKSDCIIEASKDKKIVEKSVLHLNRDLDKVLANFCYVY